MGDTRQSGFTLLEVVTGVTLVAAGFLGVAGLQVANGRAQADTAQEAAASNAFRNLTEQIRSVPFQDIPATYQGLVFAVDEIDAQGVITVILDETRTDGIATQLGLPRDLDGDQLPNTPDVSSNFTLLPVHMQLIWSNRRGETLIRDHFVLLSPGG